MSDLAALSNATSEALRDAEAQGAKIAAHFLRVQIHELFREARQRRHPQRCTDCEFAPADTHATPATRRHEHG